jgi:uncharacterized protein (TIGR02001 family)
VYGALTYGPVTAKLSYALNDLFGNYNFGTRQSTKGSTYAELNGSFDLGAGFTLAPHVGHQQIVHIANASYTDYSLTVMKDIGSGVTLGAAVLGTDADKGFYVPGAAANSSQFLGRTSLVISAKIGF